MCIKYVFFAENHTEVLPLRVMHGRLPILGYRIGQLGYITDMLTMPEESNEQLAGIDVLVMNALRIASHPTHQNLEEALPCGLQQRIAPPKFLVKEYQEHPDNDGRQSNRAYANAIPALHNLPHK